MRSFLFVILMVSSTTWAAEVSDPLEVQIGERLFRETRFSQFFFEFFDGHWNTALAKGDPALDNLMLAQGSTPHPMRGQSMSCASCHMLDQAAETVPLGTRTYSDFSLRSPVSIRPDGQIFSTRHSMSLVGVSLEPTAALHWDGEFFTPEDLSHASLIGRNMGWLDQEAKIARHHVAEVIRNDDGTFPLAFDLAGSYRTLFAAAPAGFALSVERADDSQIMDAVARFLGAYMRSLDFQRDANGEYSGSSYDRFLALNGLPRKPDAGEPAASYAARLAAMIEAGSNWQWVQPGPTMKYHSESQQFGRLEMEGMKLFFGKAACVKCHIPPAFSDGSFHVTGISQFAYEAVHGSKTFAQLHIPDLNERLRDSATYLIASEAHPFSQGLLRQEPEASDPRRADLGVWNIFANPDKAAVQPALREALCRASITDCAALGDVELLRRTAAMFKTPGLRDLGQSAPYLHNGSAATLEDVLIDYMRGSVLARRGGLVNASPQMSVMHLRGQDIPPLKAFLKALNEDYD